MNNLNPPIVPLSELFDPPKEATPAVELERQIMSSMVPKSEREHWAAKEIDRLRAEVLQLRRELEYIRLTRTECMCSGCWGVNHREFTECSRCKRLRELKAAGIGEAHTHEP